MVKTKQMSAIDVKTSEAFAVMSSVAAFFVVVLHVGGTVSGPADGSILWFVDRIAKFVSSIAVPFFFFASGFFLAGHVGESGWWRRSMRVRLRTLVVPYLFWSVLWTVFFGGVCCFSSVRQGKPFFDGLHAFSCSWILGLDLGRAPCYSVMWYVRSLLIFVVLSGFIVWWLEKFKWAAFATMAMLLLLWRFVFPLGPVYTFCHYHGLLFFILGIMLRMTDFHMTIPHSVRGLRNLARYSFHIYLLHSFFIAIFRLLITKRGDTLLILGSQLLFAYGGALLLAWGLERYARWFCRIAFGGR